MSFRTLAPSREEQVQAQSFDANCAIPPPVQMRDRSGEDLPEVKAARDLLARFFSTKPRFH